MKYCVQITSVARQDLIDIAQIISEECGLPQAAKSYILELKEVIDGLSLMPQRCRIYDVKQNNGQTIRISRFKKYSIFFYINEKDYLVIVFAILYSGMDLPAALEQRE